MNHAPLIGFSGDAMKSLYSAPENEAESEAGLRTSLSALNQRLMNFIILCFAQCARERRLGRRS